MRMHACICVRVCVCVCAQASQMLRKALCTAVHSMFKTGAMVRPVVVVISRSSINSSSSSSRRTRRRKRRRGRSGAATKFKIVRLPRRLAVWPPCKPPALLASEQAASTSGHLCGYCIYHGQPASQPATCTARLAKRPTVRDDQGTTYAAADD